MPTPARDALLWADFKPHTLSLGSDIAQLGIGLSPMAGVFFQLAWGHETEPTLGDVFTAEPWDANALDWYHELELDDRMDVLGLAGFFVHETVHKLDLLTTPFGAAFLGRTCLETLGLQRDSRD